MSLFDLLFLFLLLVAALTLLLAAVRALRGDGAGAVAQLRRLGIGAAAYLAVVWLVALVSPGERVTLGEDRCADDWCLAVTEVTPSTYNTAPVLDVEFRLSSRARRVTQRERDVLVYLRDAAGHRIPAEAAPSDAPFDALLQPGQVIFTHRYFALPAGTAPRDLVITRGGFPFPGAFIIGEATAVVKPDALGLEGAVGR